MAEPMKFICVCGKHGQDVHDGSKNPCCDDSVTIPMATDLSVLNDAGQKLFREDAVALHTLVSTQGVKLTESANAWFNSVVKPLIDQMKIDQAHEDVEMMENTAESGAVGDDDHDTPEEDTDFSEKLNNAYLSGHTAGYEAGYEAAFSAAFLKGFDTGVKCHPTPLKK